jgi:hypothetical protein
MEMKDFDNMVLAIPTVCTGGNSLEFKPLKSDDSLLKILEGGSYDQNLMKFEKKSPIWSEKRNSFVLNFGKRIKQPSIK